jgi:anti-sigma regulatory factor (Ser/Thr protein kinase)
VTAGSAPTVAVSGLVHEALFYRTTEEYLAGVGRFARAGLEAGDPVLVAVPGREKIDALRTATAVDGRVAFADMRRVGRNPARIIPFVRAFADWQPDRRLWFVGEPVWPDRTDPEYQECVRHEALLNAAFADAAVSIFCPYDMAGLDQLAIADACRTHPVLVDTVGSRESPRYTDPAVLYAAEDRPLPEPSGDVDMLPYGRDDLHLIRGLVRYRARLAGLSEDRADDLLTAVNEIATNTVSHTGAGGTLRIWRDAATDRLVCELRDGGRIDDMLAGRRRPDPEADHGRGLWLANQFCDLVELRSNGAGTTVRLHAAAG